MGMEFVRYISLPYHIRGFTVVDPEGNYNIYINNKLTEEMQAEALAHEMEHIANGHFSDAVPMELVENYL